MEERILMDYHATRIVTEKRRNGPTWDRIPVGKERVFCDVMLDHTALLDMCSKAGHNKSGRSKLGALTVVVRRRKREAL